MSEEKAAASPAPVAIKSPVSQRSPSRSLPPVASSGTANLREGDAFWKNLLSDLRLLDKGRFCRRKNISFRVALRGNVFSLNDVQMPQMSTKRIRMCDWTIWMCLIAVGALRLVVCRIVSSVIQMDRTHLL